MGCIENFTTIPDLADCINDCIDDRDDCESNCPEGTPEFLKEAVWYRYLMDFWWTTGCVGNMNGTPDQSDDSGWINSGPPDPITIPLTDDLTTTSIAYCINITVLVIYDDGTCCAFVDVLCVDIC